MTPSPAPSPRTPRWPRRQSRLPPGWPVKVRGIDVAYDARIAFARLWQLYRIHVQAPTLPDGFRWRDTPMPPEVRELAAQCDLLLGPAPNRVVVVCPTCEHEASVLDRAGGGWCCRGCDAPRWSAVDAMMAGYAHGLMIGLGGREMRRRERLAHALTRVPVSPRLGAVLATSPSGERLPPLSVGAARELGRLAARVVGVAALAEYSPHWVRRHPQKGEPPGPRACLGMGAVEDAIAEYLNPSAYLTFLGGSA